MPLPEVTEMQKRMDAACGHTVEVHLYDTEMPVVGKCINYTKPLDNDPEVAAIEVKVPGMPSLYEITESEIETLNIKAKNK